MAVALFYIGGSLAVMAAGAVLCDILIALGVK